MLKNSIFYFLVCYAPWLAYSQNMGCQSAKQYKALASIYYCSENLRSDTFDVLNTTINLEIGNSSNPTIAGHSIIRFAPKLNGRNFIRFDLLKMTIDSVKESTTHLTFAYNDTILKINFTSPKNIIDISDITIYYHGTPQMDATGWGGFYFDNTQGAEYAFNLGVGFGAKPHNYGRVWFPCFDNFVERSAYEFNITSDVARSAYCNGQLISNTISNNKRTCKWILNEHIPSYLVSVALANYTQVNWSINTLNGIKPITLAAVAADTTALKSSFINLKNCIAGFENYFGPYVWNRFGYALVPFASGAMEHATNIAYPRAFIGNLNHESDLMAHELAHHWWGDLITCETQEDMWINEGMATYSGYLFLEWQYGKAKYLNAVKTEHDNLLHFLYKNEGFRAISGVPHSLTYGDHVYKKGADVAHTLRGYMGDVNFFNATKYTLQQQAFKSINSNEFKNLLQISSSQNLNDFFTDWIFSGGWSHFAIDSVNYVTQSSNSIDAIISVKQKLYGTTNLHNNVPLEVSFFKNDWSKEVRKITMSGAANLFTVNLPFTPVYYAINYDSKINDASSHEIKVIKSASNVTWTLGKVFTQIKNKGVDSSLIRIVHNYVAPDGFKHNPHQHKLSNQHYWRVEGILAQGFKSKIRFNYDGSKNLTGTYAYMDTLLTIVNGDSIGLFFRKDATQEWEWLRNAFKFTSSNKAGYIEIDSLQLGEYAFGNVADTNALLVMKNSVKRPIVNVFPNPGKQVLYVELEEKPVNGLTCHIIDMNGRLVLTSDIQSKKAELNLHLLVSGTYIIELKDKTGLVYSQKIVVEK